MTSRKLLALTGGVIALFAFIFFFERKMPTTSEREQKGDLYWDLPADRVESIRLEHGREIVELAKSGESWKLVKPESYPADAVTASDLASQLAGLKQPPARCNRNRRGARARTARARKEDRDLVDRAPNLRPRGSGGRRPPRGRFDRAPRDRVRTETPGDRPSLARTLAAELPGHHHRL